MKTFFSLAFLFCLCYNTCRAEGVGQRTTLAEAGKIIEAIRNQYGGVEIATASFNTNNLQLFSGVGELLAFTASTSTSGNYIDFRSTGSSTGDETHAIIASIPLSTAETGTRYIFPFALPTKLGIAANPNVGTIRSITYYFRAKQDE